MQFEYHRVTYTQHHQVMQSVVSHTYWFRWFADLRLDNSPFAKASFIRIKLTAHKLKATCFDLSILVSDKRRPIFTVFGSYLQPKTEHILHAGNQVIRSTPAINAQFRDGGADPPRLGAEAPPAPTAPALRLTQQRHT